MLENNQRKYEEKVNNFFDNAASIQSDTNSPTSNRPLNKPRQVIVTGTPTFPNKEKNTPTVHNVEAPAPTGQIEVTEEVKTNAIDELAKETDAIINVKPENFFKKFINKIKSFLVRK